MAALTWNHARTVGVQAIDDQHGILLDALNELGTALKLGAECETVRMMLDRITELTRLHVENEERLLERYQYPGLDEYRAEHRHLLDQLAARPAVCNSQSRHKQSDSVYELAEFLREWFMAHTEEAGLVLGPWLQECGVR